MPRKKLYDGSGRKILSNKRKGGYRGTPPQRPKRIRKDPLAIEGFNRKEGKIVHYLSDPVDIRPLHIFCSEEHIPIPECARIMRIPKVQVEVNKRLEDNIKTSKALILKRVFAQVQSRGTPQAAKLFLEATGEFVPTSKVLHGEGPHKANEMSDKELDGEIGRLLSELGKRYEGKKWIKAAQEGKVPGRRSDIGKGVKHAIAEADAAAEEGLDGSDAGELGTPEDGERGEEA